MPARRALITLSFLLALAGCDALSRKPAPPAEPAEPAAPIGASTEPGATAPPEAAPAAKPEAPQDPVQEAVEVPPGEGTTPTPLSPGAETVVDPASTFRVVLAGTCRDARLLLLDGAGAAVPAAERAEIAETTVLALAPAAPLAPGSRYQLRLDGAVGRELHLGDRGYPPTRWTLRAAGDPAPSPARAGKQRRKRR